MQDKTWYSILGLDAEPLFLQDDMLKKFSYFVKLWTVWNKTKIHHVKCIKLYIFITGKHFNNLLTQYGAPVVILNLVKKKEKYRKHESLLADYMHDTVNYLNTFLHEENHLHYTHFDMARCRLVYFRIIWYFWHFVPYWLLYGTFSNFFATFCQLHFCMKKTIWV